jgi:hypothetical protein
LSNMPTVTLTLPRLHDAQNIVKRERKRYNVINCGRRFGKTTLGIDLTIKPIMAGYPVGWYNPTYKMLSEVWREVKNLYAPVISKKNESDHRLEMVTGGVLDMWSLQDPDGSRGRKYKRVLIDEAAKVDKLEEAWTQVIRQTLTDYQGDGYFMSTPKGLNYFHTLWGMAEQSPALWYSRRFTTYDNPHLKREEIDAMRAELPERVFQQEILAEFLADGSYFQGVTEAATIDQPDQPDQHRGHYLVMGVDWALSQDYTVLTVGCRDCNRVVDWERFNKLDFTYQRERLFAMAKRWDVAGILPERNSIGQPNIELIIGRVPVLRGPDNVPGFNTSATTKPGLIQGLATAIEHDGFQIPKDYADELRAYEVETMASGHPKFGAPDGMHDDRVISLALCWRAMTTGSWLIRGITE